MRARTSGHATLIRGEGNTDPRHQLHVEFIPRVAKVLIIWKNAYARIALSQSMVPTTHS